MGKVIIGIHGLANKPEEQILAGWWRDSIVEGLQKNEGVVGDPFDGGDAEFRMICWAKYLYKQPLHADPLYSFDEHFNSEPYKPADDGALQEHIDSFFDKVRAKTLDFGGSMVDVLRNKFGATSVAEWFLGKVLKDLAFYYDTSRKLRNDAGEAQNAREVLDSKLETAAKTASGEGHEIMIIAHSMGTIIGYNTLRNLGRKDNPPEVKRFITIGSPLGLPYVKSKIAQERPYDSDARTPTIVSESWTNFADPKDPVALDIHLRDDYSANASGIRVRDDLVANDYYTIDEHRERKPNHHKSYGYLRTPELSREVKSFLGL